MSSGTSSEILEFRILGPLEVRHQDQEIKIGSFRQRTVLAHLLLGCNHVIPIEKMAESIWSGDPPETAKTQIAICVSRLRKAFRESGFEHELIKTVHPGYMLPSGPHRIDAAAFEEKINLARDGLRNRRIDEALKIMSEALGLWRGPVLSGMPALTLGADIRRLEEKRLSVREELAELRLERGEHRQLIPELIAALHEHPLREMTRAALMLALYRTGRRSESTDLFREAYRKSIEELGIAPGHQLQEMHQAILRDDPALLRYRGAAKHSADGTTGTQIPLDVPCFIGRTEQLAELDRLVDSAFSEESLNLGVVTGGPGVGKSALATRWAHRTASTFPDGRLFVRLGCGPDSEGNSSAQALVQVLRALDDSDADEDEPLDKLERRYQEAIAEKRLLLIFDDIRDAEQLESLLPLSNTCCVLITARTMLEIQAPVCVNLSPLSENQAVDFLDRVLSDGRVQEDLPGTTRLVKVCDGLPLALSCAVTRLQAKPHWSLRRLVSRLENPRHRLDELRCGTPTLRERFDRIYTRLAPTAAAMYRRLSLLEGARVDLVSASALLGTDRAATEEILEQLVDAQLLNACGEGDGGPAYELSSLLTAHSGERLRSDEVPEERHKAKERLNESEMRKGAHLY